LFSYFPRAAVLCNCQEDAADAVSESDKQQSANLFVGKLRNAAAAFSAIALSMAQQPRLPHSHTLNFDFGALHHLAGGVKSEMHISPSVVPSAHRETKSDLREMRMLLSSKVNQNICTRG
jgi:hypothetical protein